MSRRIGFIGLGVMGKPMAKNLLKAGYELHVFDLDPGACEVLERLGARRCRCSKEVASRSEVVITMLPNSPDVQAVVFGDDGIAEGAKPGTVLIDMSSIDPEISRSIAAELKRKGIRMLDAPVSGGEPKAIDGTLSIMVGGELDLFESTKEILAQMGSSVVRIGDIGSGNVAKLANQIVVALNIAAVSEAFVYAAKAGVDPEVVFQAIRGGLAGSTVMNLKAPMMLERRFDPGFRIELHAKDLTNALNAGHKIGVPLPLTAQMLEILHALVVDDKGRCDHSAIVQYFERLAGRDVKPSGK